MGGQQIDPTMQETAFPERRNTTVGGEESLRDQGAACINIKTDSDTMLNVGESEVATLSGATESVGELFCKQKVNPSASALLSCTVKWVENFLVLTFVL
jgi:hypothetical protein